jgi:hypothetical protein
VAAGNQRSIRFIALRSLLRGGCHQRSISIIALRSVLRGG